MSKPPPQTNSLLNYFGTNRANKAAPQANTQPAPSPKNQTSIFQPKPAPAQPESTKMSEEKRPAPKHEAMEDESIFKTRNPVDTKRKFDEFKQPNIAMEANPTQPHDHKRLKKTSEIGFGGGTRDPTPEASVDLGAFSYRSGSNTGAGNGNGTGRAKLSPPKTWNRPAASLSPNAKSDDNYGSDKTEELSDASQDSGHGRKIAPAHKPPMRTKTAISPEKKAAPPAQPKKRVITKDTFANRVTADDIKEIDTKIADVKAKKGGGGFWGKKKKPSVNKDDLVQGPFTGTTIVFTGMLESISREDAENLLRTLGAKVTGSVSGRTSYLVAGYKLEDNRPTNTSSKYRKAQEVGVKILEEADLEALVVEKTNHTMQEHQLGVVNLPGPSSPKAAPVSAQKSGGAPSRAAPAPVTAAIQPGPGYKKEGDILSKTIEKKPLPQQATQATQPLTQPVSQPGTMQKKPPAAPIKVDSQLWTTKYAPVCCADILGNGKEIQGLIDWLRDWQDVHFRGMKKEIKFHPNMRKENFSTLNVNAKGCMISGPPGIGKTTTVRLVAKALGFTIIEQNASDIRNKNAVQTVLGNSTGNLLINRNADSLATTNNVILMDEVDGMCSDRGGVAALNAIIKESRTPVICICNDRMHPKMRTLANNCYDLRFHKPNKIQISKRILEIAKSEGMKVDQNSLDLLVESMNNDIRQILNFLQMWSKKSDTMLFGDLKKRIDSNKKDESGILTPFDAAHKLLQAHERGRLNVRQKLNLFFVDYNLIPLLIQENYLSSSLLKKESLEDMERMAKASEVLAQSDILSRAIHVNGEWGLMPNFGYMSSVYPAELANSNQIMFPKFTEFFPKFSSQRKCARELKEIKTAMAPTTMCNSLRAIKFDYSESILGLLLFHLYNEGKDAVDKIIDIMEEYHITKVLFDENLQDVQFNPQKTNFLQAIPSQAKASLTRIYNALHKSSLKPKKAKNIPTGEAFAPLNDPEKSEDEHVNEEEEEGEEDNDDDVINTKDKPKAKKKAGGAPRGGGAGRGGRGGGRGARGGRGGRGKSKGRDDDEDELDDDDDDLDDFIVDDDDEEMKPAAKRGGSTNKKKW